MLKLLLVIAAAGNLAAARGSLRPLPVVFEAGLGGQFRAHASGRQIVLRDGGIEAASEGGLVRLGFMNSRRHLAAEGVGELSGRLHYLTGNDRSLWRTDVRVFSRVRFRDVYPGIDVEYYGTGGELEFDLVVSPGADPGVVSLQVGGGGAFRIDRNGDLVTRDSLVRLRSPKVYQEDPGGRRELRAGYVLHSRNCAGFFLAQWDKSRTLVIDPVLFFSTYLGGSGDEVMPGSSDDGPTVQVALDRDGNVYVAGNTRSTDFPAKPLPMSVHANVDAFVAKLDPTGSRLIYCTYLGGTGIDRAFALTVDSDGQAYIGGRTLSPNLPVSAAAYQRLLRGPEDGFIAKLSADGSSLVFATYLGGSMQDCVWALALDQSGDTWVTGETSSPDFPVTGGLTPGFKGRWDGAVCKLNSDGSAVRWCTLMGGSGIDTLFSVALDPAGNAWVAGWTTSPDFPPIRALQPAFGGGARDAAVAQLSSNGELLFASWLGGSGYDAVIAAAGDPAGNVYLAGNTTSTNFPVTAKASQAAFGGVQDGFLVVLRSAARTVSYSSYFGSTGAESAIGIAVDPEPLGGTVNVVGGTTSAGMTQFPGAVQPQHGGTTDAFLARFAPPDFGLAHFTYLGGSGQDIGLSVAVDSAGSVVLAGITASANFPTNAGARQTQYGGGASDAFVTRIATAEAVPMMQALPSASASAVTGFAPEALVSLFGEKLAESTEAPASPAVSVGGVSVTVKDSEGVVRNGLVLFVSPAQVNFVLPAGTAMGLATISVMRQAGGVIAPAAVAQCSVQVDPVAPAIFAANADGKGPAAAIFIRYLPDGSSPWQYTFRCAAPGSCVTEPLNLGGGVAVLQLYGSGIRGRSGSLPVKARVGGVEVDVQFAGAQGGFPGLDQVNLILPPSLGGRGEVDVLLDVDGRTTNIVSVAFR